MDDDGIDRLRRWEDAGGTWQVLVGRSAVADGSADGSPEGSADGVLVSLCRCDGGEEVERVRLPGEDAAAYLRLRPTSEDPEPA